MGKASLTAQPIDEGPLDGTRSWIGSSVGHSIDARRFYSNSVGGRLWGSGFCVTSASDGYGEVLCLAEERCVFAWLIGGTVTSQSGRVAQSEPYVLAGSTWRTFLPCCSRKGRKWSGWLGSLSDDPNEFSAATTCRHANRYVREFTLPIASS